MDCLFEVSIIVVILDLFFKLDRLSKLDMINSLMAINFSRKSIWDSAEVFFLARINIKKIQPKIDIAG